MKRRAFTLTELLIAAAATATVAMTAATLTSAVSNASIQTQDLRQISTTGNFAMNRMAHAIRTARAIGEVQNHSVSLWIDDANNDDQVNLYECGILRYHAATKQIRFEYMQSASEPPPATVVSAASFKNTATLDSLMGSSDRKIVVWADHVEHCEFAGYPGHTETRIVEAVFTIQTDGGSLDFRVAMGLRASADYLFDNTAHEEYPLVPSNKLRKKISKWTGLN